MFTRRTIAANMLKARRSWKVSRCLATDDAAKDPARKLLDGTAKMNDLTIRELKAALDYRNVSYSDCFDRFSLSKRLAGCMLQESREGQEDKAKRREEEADEAKGQSRNLPLEVMMVGVHFLQHIPWRHFVISKKITGFDKDSLLVVPDWEYARAVAGFKKHGKKNSDIAAEERAFLVEHFARKRLDTDSSGDDPCENAPVGIATVLLFFHGEGELVRQLKPPEEPQSVGEIGQYHGYMIPCLTPVPKNWSPQLASCPLDSEGVLHAIEVARNIAGECEAIEDTDVYGRDDSLK